MAATLSPTAGIVSMPVSVGPLAGRGSIARQTRTIWSGCHCSIVAVRHEPGVMQIASTAADGPGPTLARGWSAVSPGAADRAAGGAARTATGDGAGAGQGRTTRTAANAITKTATSAGSRDRPPTAASNRTGSPAGRVRS
jgi:hypothetical protein